MRRNHRFVVTIVLSAACLAMAIVSCPVKAAKPAKAKSHKRQTVRLGLVQTLFRDLPEALVQVLLKPFKTLMEDQTGVSSELVTASDHEQLGQQLMENKVQLGIFHGFEFAWARLKHPELKPLLLAVNKDVYFRSILVVREDCPAQGIGELQSKILVLPRASREHCRLYTQRRCTPPGVAVDKFYRQVLTAADVEEALDEVVDGKATATVVDQVELEGYRKEKPGRAAKLKKLMQSELFPSAVIAYNPAVLPKSLFNRFRDGMTSAGDTRKGRQMLQLCRITSFQSAPENYQDVLAEIAKAYPPPEAK